MQYFVYVNNIVFTAPGSSKGRTPAFEAGHLGSIPSPGAVHKIN